LNKTEKLTEQCKRAVTPTNALAREYGDADISKVFPENGNTDPGTEDYASTWRRISLNGRWRSRLGSDPDELVTRGAERIALAGAGHSPRLRRRLECDGKWTGVPLGDLMHKVQPLPTAKFVVFHCADVDDEGVAYYESMALADCYHPQTILAYELNGNPSMYRTARRSASPLRTAARLQQAKYVMMIPIGGRPLVATSAAERARVLGGSRLRVVRKVSSRMLKQLQQEEVSRHLDAVRTWPSHRMGGLAGRLSSYYRTLLVANPLLRYHPAHSEYR